MQRMTAAALVALTSCLVLASDHITPPLPRSAFSIVLHLANPASPNRSDCILTIAIGDDAFGASTNEPPLSAELAQYLQSLREAARDTLFKCLHMA